MNQFIDNVHTVHNNPFLFTPLIIKFYENLFKQPKNILLSYLVLPLVLNEESRKKLQTVNITSSIITFKKDQRILSGLPERVNLQKEMTNLCIQYALDKGFISIQNDMSINLLKQPEKMRNSHFIEYLKASSNLYKIFGELDIVSIYRALGVKVL